MIQVWRVVDYSGISAIMKDISSQAIPSGQPQQQADASGADEAFVDHVKKVGVFQGSCYPLLVVQLLVHCSFCGMSTRCDVYVDLYTLGFTLRTTTCILLSMQH